jgi:hypothetical protein
MAVNQAVLAAAMTVAIGNVNNTISTIGALETAPTVVMQTLYLAAGNALAPFNAAIAAFEADIDQTTFGGATPGVPGLQVAYNLLTQASDLTQEWQTIVAQAYLIRVATNAYNAPG